MMKRIPVSIRLLCAAGCLAAVCGCSGKTETKSSASPPASSAAKSSAPRKLTDQRSDGIRVEEDGRTFRHQPSQTLFRLPDGWKVIEPKRRGEVEFLKVFDGNSTARADIIWSPLQGTLANAVKARVESLRKSINYGAANVLDPKSVTINGKTGWRIDLKVGYGKNTKLREVIYYFAVAPGTLSRWRIGIWVTLDAGADNAVGRQLVKQFDWEAPAK